MKNSPSLKEKCFKHLPFDLKIYHFIVWFLAACMRHETFNFLDISNPMSFFIPLGMAFHSSLSSLQAPFQSSPPWGFLSLKWNMNYYCSYKEKVTLAVQLPAYATDTICLYPPPPHWWLSRHGSFANHNSQLVSWVFQTGWGQWRWELYWQWLSAGCATDCCSPPLTDSP